jgi:hypothetical protein
LKGIRLRVTTDDSMVSVGGDAALVSGCLSKASSSLFTTGGEHCSA